MKSNQHNTHNIFNQTSLLLAIDKILPLSEHYKEILKIHIQTLKQCENIVDLACGTGILTLKYLKEGKFVTAVDISEESLNLLENKTKKFKNLKIIKANITDLDFIPNGNFDGVSVMIASHLIDDFRKHIQECFRILEPNGCFVITARIANQDQRKIVKIVKNSLVSLGKFQKLKNDFKIVKNQLLETADTRSKSFYSTDDVLNILKDSGFQNIRKMENKTEGVMYTFIAKKLW